MNNSEGCRKALEWAANELSHERDETCCCYKNCQACKAINKNPVWREWWNTGYNPVTEALSTPPPPCEGCGRKDEALRKIAEDGGPDFDADDMAHCAAAALRSSSPAPAFRTEAPTSGMEETGLSSPRRNQPACLPSASESASPAPAKPFCWNCGYVRGTDPREDCMDAICIKCRAPYAKDRCAEFGFEPAKPCEDCTGPGHPVCHEHQPPAPPATSAERRALEIAVEAIEDVVGVASGEQQTCEDDTAALEWIDKKLRLDLKKIAALAAKDGKEDRCQP